MAQKIFNEFDQWIQCSIGSMGLFGDEEGVQNITVRSATFTGTQNGLRIKTWAHPYKGFVKGVTFENAVMKNVQNPIVIDQNYCPSKKNCPSQVTQQNTSTKY